MTDWILQGFDMTVKLAQIKKRQKTLERRPKVGDVFRLRFEDGRWLLGRVATVGVPYTPGEGPSEDLLTVYLFKSQYDGSSPLPLLLPLGDLLCAPLIVGNDMWREGTFEHLEHRDFRDGERLPHHCFFSMPFDKHFDEYGREVARPSEPIGEFGITTGEGVEAAIADALGERVWYQHLMEGSPEGVPSLASDIVVPVAKYSVVLFVPSLKEGGEQGLNEIEGTLIAAVESNGAGKWQGHGYNADLMEWNVRFVGREPRRIRDALLPVLKTLSLPPGSYLVVGGKHSIRHEL